MCQTTLWERRWLLFVDWTQKSLTPFSVGPVWLTLFDFHSTQFLRYGTANSRQSEIAERLRGKISTHSNASIFNPSLWHSILKCLCPTTTQPKGVPQQLSPKKGNHNIKPLQTVENCNNLASCSMKYINGKAMCPLNVKNLSHKHRLDSSSWRKWGVFLDTFPSNLLLCHEVSKENLFLVLYAWKQFIVFYVCLQIHMQPCNSCSIISV